MSHQSLKELALTSVGRSLDLCLTLKDISKQEIQQRNE